MTEPGPQPSDDAVAQPSTTPSTSSSTAVAPAAASEAPYTYYYQYCFHLSPTFNKWCPMRVIDVLRLDEFDAFEGQNVFFHKNHPIKWVRVAGVVVSFADYNGRHVYVLDDGSGVAIECVVPGARPAAGPLADRAKRKTGYAFVGAGKSAAAATLEKEAKEESADRAAAPMDGNIGKVIEVRGELHLYRTMRSERFMQVQVAKLTVLRGTQQEVQFWHKVNTFARETLDKPWQLDKQTVRACRKSAFATKKEPQRQKAPAPSSKSRAQPSETRAPSPPRRPKKKWRLRPDTPDRDDAGHVDCNHETGDDAVVDAVPCEVEPEPYELEDQLSPQPAVCHHTGSVQRSNVASGCGLDPGGVYIEAEADPPPKPRKKWNVGYAR